MLSLPQTLPLSDPFVHREGRDPSCGPGRGLGEAGEALPLGVLKGQAQSLSVFQSVTFCSSWIFSLVSMF